MCLLNAVQPVATLDPIIVPLVSICSVALTILAGFFGAWFQGRREHTKWQRDQRLKAYGDFFTATDNFLGAAHRGDESELSAVARDSLRSAALVRLLGPDDVYQAAAHLQDATKASVLALERRDPLLDQREDERLVAREAFIEIARAKIKMNR
ncbi:hypothetical protein E3T55_05755 [Cryobacterium frigoriphilum]|uniref:Uncharacterized protein n=1 Tax=Cryobacterium frigoriphilum TaxID=1259150 RepID=A0A4R9A624_9MICO|nr:hypothetical protein [Cryobacterium frigoriphilum]TFD53005.1 hypothetical protein E3T55_05755 [Cryobacterium frigoriphilum]